MAMEMALPMGDPSPGALSGLFEWGSSNAIVLAGDYPTAPAGSATKHPPGDLHVIGFRLTNSTFGF